jgi:hypothetical protein
MLVFRSTMDAAVAAHNADNIRLQGELADARRALRELGDLHRKAIDATEADRAMLADVARNLHTAILDATNRGTEVIGKELTALRLELARERAQRELLAGQLRIAQKDADWLRVLVNTSNTERATLLAQHGVSLPVPTLRPFMAANPDNREGAGMGSGQVGVGLPGPLQEMLESGLMDDMGDAAAEAAGLHHDETGSLHFGPMTNEG